MAVIARAQMGRVRPRHAAGQIRAWFHGWQVGGMAAPHAICAQTPANRASTRVPKSAVIVAGVPQRIETPCRTGQACRARVGDWVGAPERGRV